uniref:Probable tRNA(His) guanylyltransferase n=1 Tax=Anopheles atroparvus TaxID=41427 RepID=A0A182JDS3_ANOAO
MHYCMRRLLNAVNKKIIRAYQSSAMALSRFEYVKQFEHEDKLLSNCWIVVRIDGKGFHRFCNVHKFDKPNDPDALQLMNMAGMTVMQEFNEIAVAFGQSDEYSFVFRRDASIYQRRRDKLVSYVASLFTSAYMFHWDRIFHSRSLFIRYPPSFDARAVLYPTDDNLRDYLSWRQADVHVNNLYNTTFWNLFNINYNNEPIMYRKGTILLQKTVSVSGRKQKLIIPIFEDLIGDEFWAKHPEILDKKAKTNGIHELGENVSQPIVQYQLEVHEKRRPAVN